MKMITPFTVSRSRDFGASSLILWAVVSAEKWYLHEEKDQLCQYSCAAVLDELPPSGW